MSRIHFASSDDYFFSVFICIPVMTPSAGAHAENICAGVSEFALRMIPYVLIDDQEHLRMRKFAQMIA